MVVLVDTFRDAPDYFWGVLQCFKKKAQLPPTVSAEPVGPDPIQVIDIQIPGSGAPGRPTTTRLIWDFSNQHTLKWEQPITALLYDDSLKCEVATTIKPGSLNLYTFPKVVWAKPSAPKGKGLGALISSATSANKKPFEVLEGAYLKLLQLIFETMARSPTERDILKLPDASGACSVLGMLVANNQAAIDTCFTIYSIWSDMIAVPHLPGFFVGENAFHVLAANSQEAKLCELIQMAYDNLPREKVTDCFSSQALGLFFTGPPMNQYGGTPIGYAASFCCRKAIALYLSFPDGQGAWQHRSQLAGAVLSVLRFLADARRRLQRIYIHVRFSRRLAGAGPQGDIARQREAQIRRRHGARVPRAVRQRAHTASARLPIG